MLSSKNLRAAEDRSVVPLLDALLGQPLPNSEMRTLSSFLLPLGPRTDNFSHSFDRAVLSGLNADRLAYAFAGGYFAALGRLVGGKPRQRYALAASEREGSHPRAIRTRLEKTSTGYNLSGEKTFVTLGDHVDIWLVVASSGQNEAGQNLLRVVQVVPKRKEGIEWRPATSSSGSLTSAVPELGHVAITLRDVPVSEADLLEGDGYERYLKPFRTVEDIHVTGSAIGYLVSVARRSLWPNAILERALAIASSLRSLSDAPPNARTIHLALAGALEEVQLLLADAEPHWASAPEEERTRFLRDQPLFQIASRARRERLASAWAAFGRPSSAE